VTLGPIYFKDVLHYAQILGLSCALTGISLEMFYGLSFEVSDSFLSVGLLLLWLQTFKLLYKFKSLGMLVRMMYAMFRDVMQWFLLQSIVLFAFGAAFFALYRDEVAMTIECGLSLEHLDTPPTEAQLGTMSLVRQLYENSQGFFYFTNLLESTVRGGEGASPLCLATSKNYLMGPLMMFLFLVTNVIMLTNMLIAMMNDSYASEKAKVEARTKLNLAWETILHCKRVAWQAPPPFNLLIFPRKLIGGLKYALCTGHSPYDALDDEAEGGARDEVQQLLARAKAHLEAQR